MERPSTATQMPGLKMVSTTAQIRPAKPPTKAPRVVSPFHSIDSSSTGKLALAATAKAKPTMNATLIFSNRTPSTMATMPSTTVVIREARTSAASSPLPWRNTEA